MMNMRIKSTLLALTMIATVPSQSRAEGVNPVEAIITFVKNHPYLVSGAVFTWAWAESDIRTKPKAEYKWSELPEDFKDMLRTFAALNPEAFKKLLAFVKKYGVGLPVKLEDMTTRTKNEDGSVVTVKGKKLTQKPFGLYGTFDAYALMHMKKFTEYVPVIAGFYVLLNNPVQSFENAVTKAATGK